MSGTRKLREAMSVRPSIFATCNSSRPTSSGGCCIARVNRSAPSKFNATTSSPQPTTSHRRQPAASSVTQKNSPAKTPG